MTGTVTNTSALYVNIALNSSNGTGFNPTIMNGIWSGSVPVALSPGSYPITVTNDVTPNIGVVLATGTLTVTGPYLGL